MSEDYLIWGVGLLAAALMLIVIEALLPTAGMVALLGVAVAIAGIICLFNVSVVWGIVGIVSFIGLGGACFLFALNIMPNTRFGRRMLHGDDAPLFEDSESLPPPPDPSGELEHLIGQQGTVITDLRPVGVIRIGETRYQGISEVGFLRAGSLIRVTAIDGTQIKVRSVT